MTFPATNPALARALAARGYDTATSVQQAVLEGAAAERDLLVSAQTGSGKTVAFGLALGATLLGDAERMPEAAAPKALIIAPTRELAMQVARELTWLYEATGARVITCVGGMDARAEARQLEGRPHIVVGTPGRLRDHLERGRLQLASLAAVVLDEADEMLDLGFREDLEFILDATPAERRTLLFSATLPRDIETLAKRYQQDALRIETVRRDEPHADIDYWAHRVVPHDVENTLVNVLRYHEARAAIVFCATREAVNRINARLIERGFSAVALSGELTQHERTRALQALRDGRARVLVATDVAARGLDLPDVALVIHAELPNDGETLLHRSGRTGRAGKKGLCVLIVPFNKRRKADALIASARIKVTWKPAPPPDEIRARDQERFFADPGFSTPAGDEELQVVRAMQERRTADEIALALVRLHRAQLPAPEELAVDTGPPPRREWQPRENGRHGERPRKPWQRDAEPNAEHRPRQARDHADAGAPRQRREDKRPMAWFRINIGRERNADPRWLLPLICRAGGVTKAEIGAIRIEQRETRFQILAEAADQFEHLARTAPKKEGHIVRVDGGAAGDIGGILDEVEKLAGAPPAAKKHPPAARRTGAPPHDAKSKGGHSADARWQNRPDGKNKNGSKPRSAKPRWSKNADASGETRKPHRQSDRPADALTAKPGDARPKRKHRVASPAET